MLDARKSIRPWLLPAVVAVTSWAVLLIVSVPLVTSVLLVLVLVVQAATGAVYWSWVRREGSASSIELLGMGLALGTLAALLGAQATTILGMGSWGWLIPTAGAAILMALGASGRVRMCRVTTPTGWDWWALLSTFVVGFLALLPSIRRTPLMNGYVVGSDYHGDLVFLEAVSHSLARFGPGGNLLLSGEAVRYHWFTYAWVGSTTDIVSADAFIVLTRVLPIVVLVAAAALAMAWARTLSPVNWVPTIAAYLVVVAAYVGAAQGVVLTYDSPSAGYSAVMGLAFALALTEYLHFRIGGRALTAVALLAVGTVGAKVSEAVVIAAATALIALVSIWYAKPLRIRVWVATIVTATGMAGAYLAFIAGISASDTNVAVSGGQAHASTYQGLDLFDSPAGIVLGTFVLVLAILPRWAGAFWLLRGRTSRFAPETVFGVGLGIAGLATLFVLRSGTNAAWFALASSGLIAVLSAVGLGRALGAVDWLRPSASGISRWRDPVVWSLGFALVINGIVLMSYGLADVTGAAVLWRGPVVAWLAALVLALLVMRSRALHGSLTLRWLVMVTTILVFTSIVARVGGSLAWDVAKPWAAPALRSFVLLLDPNAHLAEAAGPASAMRITAVRGVATSVGAEDTRGAADGVARTSTIIQWSPALNDGALWLKGHAAPDDLVAMDLVWHEPFLPIISAVPAYLAGVPYTSGYTTADGAAQIEPRRALVEGFTSAPTAEAAVQLWSHGVRWLWVQSLHGPDLNRLTPYGQILFSNDEVSVVQLNDPGANSS